MTSIELMLFSQINFFSVFRKWKAMKRQKRIGKFFSLQNENKLVKNRYVQCSWRSKNIEEHCPFPSFLDFSFADICISIQWSILFLSPQKKHWEWNECAEKKNRKESRREGIFRFIYLSLFAIPLNSHNTTNPQQ